MRVSLIGSGNVATHLALACVENNIELINVYSKSFDHAKHLADTCHAMPVSSISELSPNIDFIIVSINDDALGELSEQLSGLNIPIVHTAGSMPMSVFSSSASYGVLYPLQTFSKSKKVESKEVPFLIEANTDSLLDKLKLFCDLLGSNYTLANSEQRLYMHIAAVFACNFSNHMYSIAEQLLTKHQLPFELLKPLILETAHKMEKLSPIAAQTGPAKRHDVLTIQKHLEALTQNPELFDLYKSISEGIEKNQNS